jgi:predicted transcriptional regulator
MTTRLPDDLYEWLRREAFETREPQNAIVIQALEAERDKRTGEKE